MTVYHWLIFILMLPSHRVLSLQRLDAKLARQARKNQGQRLAAGEKLQKQEAVQAANYENAAKFDNLDAAASKNKANRFGEQQAFC